MNIKKELDRIKEVRVNRTDEQCEMLSKQKLARHYENISEGNCEVLEKDELVRLGDYGLYECFIPLYWENGIPKQYLSVGYMWSYATPTPEEFLEITPIDLIEDSANEYAEKTGDDIRDAAFNAFQDCVSNPKMITFRKLKPEQIKHLYVNDTSRRRLKNEKK